MQLFTGPGVPEPQAALDKIKIIENHDPLVDLRTIPHLTFSDNPIHQVIPFLRAPVAKMLAEAVQQLAPDYNVCITSALRDYKQQKEIWQHQHDRLVKEHPEWPAATLRRMINKYVAPVDHPAPPGHCTGAAVDITLRSLNGSPVDLVPPDIEDWSLSYTWTDRLEPEIKKHRMRLVQTMLSVGFSNCRDEYWHYSWGDSGWAVRTGATTCPYGVINPPEGY